MEERNRNSGTETNDTDDSPQKPARRRRTPSADPSDKNDVKKRRSRSHSRSRSSRSRSPSASRGRRRRSRSRGHFSPDRRYGRFNRGPPRDFYNRRNRRSPSRSPGGYRGRNRNNRRSRSSSYDRYRNRRNTSTSRDRSASQGPPPPPTQAMPPAPNFQNDYVPPHYQPEYPVVPSQPYSNTQFGNYDYVPMMTAPPNPFSAYPPPPTQTDYTWSTQVPPPPIISCAPGTQEPPPMAVPTKPISEPDEEKQKREAAIAEEKRIQRETIKKQRDDYIRRASALKRELITLKEQREELVTGNAPPSPTTVGFVKENDRLQSQIENKIGTIENVIEMLNGILNADKSDNESPMKMAKQALKPAQSPNSDDSSPERLKTKVIESLSKKRKDSDRSRNDEKSSKSRSSQPTEQINYTFFDPEQHWCKVCGSFPKTAKEYLLHLHCDEHKMNAKPPDIPWHDNLVKDDMPTYPNAPNKRTPIRGLQFFVPSTAWYCKLCCYWIGDLHCASSHLKSKTHAKEYEKFMMKNPQFENEWIGERQKAFEAHRELEQSQKVVVAPSPPIISAQKPSMMAPSPSSLPMNAPSFLANPNRLFDGIPLQINQRAKEPPKEPIAGEETEKKKGKKKKKEKKKRKKSKKKHRHSSSSSSSSSEESDEEASVETKAANDKIIDSSTSIRVAMRNAVNAAPPTRTHLKPKSDDEENRDAIGGWMVVQAEPKAIPPKPPTISANGEAQNRRDDAMISQWTPMPVISEKEKQLFEQLKGKLKHREDKQREKSPPSMTKTMPPLRNIAYGQTQAPPTTSQQQQQQQHQQSGSEQSSKSDDRRRDDSEKDSKDVKEKTRRDAYRKRRSRSPSTPRRDRRSRSRSPRRDRRRRTRSPPSRRDRRYSRSPRRDRRRDRYSRSKSRSRERLNDKDDNKSDKNSKMAEKSNAAAKKHATSTAPGKKLPFIGRMPVFKKQSTEEEGKKLEPVNEKAEEEKLLQKKKQDELKFTIHQKQQLLQMQQKQAEAYNLAHPGQFANIYNTHGTIHHILPAVQPEEYDLMPDPMQYATMLTAPPPPAMPEPEVPQHYEDNTEPVLPPGIDEEEAEKMELEAVVPPPPPATDKDGLPKDFQDALSIIFDKGAEKAADNNGTPTAAAATAAAETENSHEIPHAVMQDDSSNFAGMEMSSMDSQHSHIEHDQNNAAPVIMEMDDQSQHYMLYGDEHYVTNHVQSAAIANESQASTKIDLATQSIPTPPIQVLDAAGNLTQIPGPVLEVGSDFVMLDPDGNRIENYTMDGANQVDSADNQAELELQHKLKQQELDDLAMLGIDASDLAAQCI